MHEVEKTSHNIDKHWLEQNSPAYKAELSDFNMQVSENVLKTPKELTRTTLTRIWKKLLYEIRNWAN